MVLSPYTKQPVHIKLTILFVWLIHIRQVLAFQSKNPNVFNVLYFCFADKILLICNDQACENMFYLNLIILRSYLFSKKCYFQAKSDFQHLSSDCLCISFFIRYCISNHSKYFACQNNYLHYLSLGNFHQHYFAYFEPRAYRIWKLLELIF